MGRPPPGAAAGPAPAPLATYLRQRTGARLVALEDAGFALADGAGLPPGALTDVLRRLRPGTLAYPDEGATLVPTVPRLDAAEPRLLLLDEPTSSLNPALQEEVVTLLGEARARGTTLVGVMHDTALLRRLADVLLTLDDGRLVAIE